MAGEVLRAIRTQIRDAKSRRAEGVDGALPHRKRTPLHVPPQSMEAEGKIMRSLSLSSSLSLCSLSLSFLMTVAEAAGQGASVLSAETPTREQEERVLEEEEDGRQASRRQANTVRPLPLLFFLCGCV